MRSGAWGGAVLRMSRWFRHYAGMMRDDKLVRAALKASQPIERVVWVWGAILESAAEVDDGGKFEVDAAEIAYFLRAPEADVGLILRTLQDLGRIRKNAVVKWGDRQFQSDRSAERQRRHRDRKRQANDMEAERGGAVTGIASDVTVTSPERDSDAPETETYTETEKNISPPSEAPPNKPNDDVRDAVGIYNQAAARVGWPLAQRITGSRRSACLSRLGECGGLEGWRAAIERAERSGFLRGESDKGWRADLDFFLQSKSFTKLMEGSYDDRAGSTASNGSGQHGRIFGALADIATQGAGERERQADFDGRPVVDAIAAPGDRGEDSGLEIPAFLRRTA